MLEAAHAANALAPNVTCKQRAEPIPPHPHRLMANVDPTLEQQVFDIAQRQREPHVHHHHQADHFGRGVEVAKRAGGLAFAGHRSCPKPQLLKNGAFRLTMPFLALEFMIFPVIAN